MHHRELKELIFEGESTTLEFKRKFTTPQKIAKEISAFANTKGGILLFGVDDDGTIVGVESEKGEIEMIVQACTFFIEPDLEPDIEIIGYHGMDIVIVSVEASEHRPHKVINKENDELQTYIRVGEQSVKASKEMIKVLEGQNINSSPIKLSIGKNEKRLFVFFETHEKATVQDFAKICNISKRRASQLMVRLVRAGVLQIHQDSSSDYFTLIEPL